MTNSGMSIDEEIAFLTRDHSLIAMVEQLVVDVPASDLFGGIRAVLPQLDSTDLEKFLVVSLAEEIRSRRRRVTLEAERNAQAVERERRQLVNRTKRGAHGNARKDGAAARGCECEDCVAQRPLLASFAEIDRKHRDRLFESLTKTMDDYAAEMKIAWTAELLDSAFAMPDGTVVLWGDATRDQHATRVSMLTKNVVANTEAAARHQRAIVDLDRNKVTSLRAISLTQ